MSVLHLWYKPEDFSAGLCLPYCFVSSSWIKNLWVSETWLFETESNFGGFFEPDAHWGHGILRSEP